MNESKTPQEIADYKTSWMSKNPFPVRINSDLDVQGKDWCRKNLPRHKWSMQSFTNVFEHTFYFEDEKDANEFSSQWPNSINQ